MSLILFEESPQSARERLRKIVSKMLAEEEDMREEITSGVSQKSDIERLLYKKDNSELFEELNNCLIS
jgi:hypothetical protein